MNLALSRRIDRWIGIPLCWLLSLWPKRLKVLPLQPESLLIILLSEMGSLVLALPMLRRLQTDYPHTQLYILVFKKNREILDVLKNIAPMHIMTIRDSSIGLFIWDSLSVIYRLLWYIKPAGVIDCELFSRVSSILAWFSGALVHVGFHPHTQEGLYRGSFITHPVLYNPYVHISQQYLNLVAALNSTTKPKGKRFLKTLPNPPTLDLFTKLEIKTFWQRFYQDYPKIQNKRLVLIYPSGGILPIRAWPHKSFLNIAQTLLKEGFAIGIIGLASDKYQATTLVTDCANPYCVNLAGYTKSIRELLLLFQRAALLVTNDGGPGQIAALTTMPTIILFGPETPMLYGPLASNVHNLKSQLSCSPCLTAYNHRNTPCDGDNQCLQAITPETVLATAKNLLVQKVQQGV